LTHIKTTELNSVILVNFFLRILVFVANYDIAKWLHFHGRSTGIITTYVSWYSSTEFINHEVPFQLYIGWNVWRYVRNTEWLVVFWNVCYFVYNNSILWGFCFFVLLYTYLYKCINSSDRIYNLTTLRGPVKSDCLTSHGFALFDMFRFLTIL
jgi:hypothetical protein